MIPMIVELSENIYVPADNKQHNYIYRNKNVIYGRGLAPAATVYGCNSTNIARGSKTASLCRKLPPKFGKFEQTNVPFRIVLRDQCMVKIIKWSLYINNISLRDGTME
jgi:hypothetical protein